MRSFLLPACVALPLGACGPPGPCEPAAWQPGELLIEQIKVRRHIGEASLVVGPDGTAALIDVVNDRHAKAVIGAVERHLGERRVDHVVLSHFHADHIGALEHLLAPSRRNGRHPLRLDGEVVSRGLFDLDDRAANHKEIGQLCPVLDALPHLALCEGVAASCPVPDEGGPWPATGCEGLLSDQGAGPGAWPLGEEAALRLLYANAHLRVGDAVERLPVAVGYETGADENARSVGGLLTWGPFALSFGGDLTGGGKDTPDIEGALAARADDLARDLPWLGGAVDVWRLHHHGIRSSNQDAFTEWMLPDDGHDRNVLVGANGIYLAAPHREVLQRISPRLGGGRVWASGTGSIAGNDPRLVDQGAVVIRVVDGGARYRVGVLHKDQVCGVRAYESVAP